MGVTYYKRFRMEIDLQRVALEEARLPEGFEFVPWHSSLISRHATVKHESFRSEVDSDVFPCLGEFSGCLNLMSEIAQRASFVPQATWLISNLGDRGAEDAGTIQGIIQAGGWGAVQNVGVAPEFRGLGLGRALILKCLQGFLGARVPRVYLEVTARNTPAVALYRSVGFRLARTTYKAVDRPVTVDYSVL